MTETFKGFLPFLLTTGSVCCGFLSVLACVMAGDGVLAAKLILLTSIMDTLDGKVARRLNRCTELGAELDVLADLASFVIAPSVLLVLLCARTLFPQPLGTPLQAVVIAIGCINVVCGAYRLARFRAADPHRGEKGYRGLPVTVYAAVVCCATILSATAPWKGHGALYGWTALIISGIVGLLMVSPFHYPKTTARTWFWLSVGVIIVGLVVSASPTVLTYLSYALLAVSIIYIASPVTVLLHQQPSLSFSDPHAGQDGGQ